MEPIVHRISISIIVVIVELISLIYPLNSQTLPFAAFFHLSTDFSKGTTIILIGNEIALNLSIVIMPM